MLCCHLKLSFSPEPWKKSTLLLLPSSPTPSVMREYFPRVWKQIHALLLETLLNQPDQLFLCLPSFWQVTIHSIRLVNVNVKWIFLWVSDQWCLPVVPYLPVALLLAVWAEEMCDWKWSNSVGNTLDSEGFHFNAKVTQGASWGKIFYHWKAQLACDPTLWLIFNYLSSQRKEKKMWKSNQTGFRKETMLAVCCLLKHCYQEFTHSAWEGSHCKPGSFCTAFVLLDPNREAGIA